MVVVLGGGGHFSRPWYDMVVQEGGGGWRGKSHYLRILKNGKMI